MFLIGRTVYRVGKAHASRRLSTRASGILSSLDIPTSSEEIAGVYDGQWRGSGDIFSSVCPTTGEILARVRTASPQELHDAIARTRDAYTIFRHVPAPRRGDILRQIRDALATKREELGALVSLEMGKIKTEGVGEVQEFIDICDYAVGLSRMMNGNVVASERPGHSILEVPNPLGVVAVLSAFNFPVAVYGWNLALSMAAGNATIWKPSPSTPLCSIAVTKIVASVLEKNGIPGAVAGLVTGGKDVGEALTESRDVELVSFTGSEHVGRIVGKTVMSRFGKTILELGGNNASIVMTDADLSMAVPSVYFGAVGTAAEFLDRLQKLYSTVKAGDPLLEGTLLGPLHSSVGLKTYSDTINHLRTIKADILTGGERYTEAPLDAGNFVRPTIAIPKSVDPKDQIWSTETFAPVLNAAIFDDIEEAITWNNSVPQGLSSSLWTRDMRNLGKWIGPGGSDTGIVNASPHLNFSPDTMLMDSTLQVNVGTSGAEIGAAFGGNKSTGWGRESGGDAWKQYVRWSACTINFSDSAPLAQGVNFTT